MESNSSRHTECVWNEELLSKNLNDEFGIESIRKEGNKSIGVVGEGHKGYYFEG